MTYVITKADFLSIVQIPNDCQGHMVEGGKFNEGHQDCRFCHGNYYAGGECNYGARHKLEDDLAIINRNFKQFDILQQEQETLSQNSKNEIAFNKAKSRIILSFQTLAEKTSSEGEKTLLYGSCIGLDASKTMFTDRFKATIKRLAAGVEFYIKKLKNLE